MKRTNTNGEAILVFGILGSAMALVLIAHFFPGLVDSYFASQKALPVVKAQPMPSWGLAAMSAPAFLIWLHFLYTEVRKIIKKHKKGWWKLKIK